MAVVSPVSAPAVVLTGTDPPAAMMIVTDPERTAIPDEGMLHAPFGLTPAESRLARLLGQGWSPDEATMQPGVRVETIRTRLKDIFEKTDTHRQADLVRLLLNAAPRL